MRSSPYLGGGRRCKGGRWCLWRGSGSSMALWAPAWLRGRRRGPPSSLRLVAAARLVAVVWVLCLVALLLLLGEVLPRLLHIFIFILPLLSDDLGNVRVGQLGIICCYLRLMMLAVQDKCWPTKRLSAAGLSSGKAMSLNARLGTRWTLQAPSLHRRGVPPPGGCARQRLHSPFRGLGILGAGVQRQMRSLAPSCLWVPALLALGDSCMPRSASTACMVEARFLDDADRRGEGEWPPSAAAAMPAGCLYCCPRST